MDAINLADGIKNGTVSDREAIAILKQISRLINHEREYGESEGNRVVDLFFGGGGTLQ